MSDFQIYANIRKLYMLAGAYIDKTDLRWWTQFPTNKLINPAKMQKLIKSI